MKKYLFLLCFLVSAFIATAADPYVTIGTNRFGFVFEDTMLSTNMQARIIDDWKIMTAPWTNVVIQMETQNNGTNMSTNIVGSVRFDGIYFGPTYHSYRCDEELKQPSLLYNHNQYCLLLSKKVTDAYKNAIDLETLYDNAVSKMPFFIQSLQPETLSSITSNQVVNICFQPGITETAYLFSSQEIISDLQGQEFFIPTLLSYFVQTKNFANSSQEFFFTKLPCRDRGDMHGSVHYFPAIYIDGMWKLFAGDE